VVVGVGRNQRACLVDQSDFWYDSFSVNEGDATVCGGALTNTSVAGKTNTGRTYCQVQGELCLRHMQISGTNATTHVLGDDVLFGLPTAFGSSAVSMRIVFNADPATSPTPRLVVYTDCNGTSMSTQYAHTATSTPPYPFTCGEDAGATAYYRYDWAGVPTTDFVPGATLAIEWVSGGGADTLIRVFEWEVAVTRPYRRRTWVNAPECDAQLQATYCPASAPSARRGIGSVAYVPPLRRRAEEVCIPTNETVHLLIVVDSSGSTSAFIGDYLAAIQTFIMEFEGQPVGVAIIDFDGPGTIFGGQGSASDAQWITPPGGPTGVYRWMDNATQVNQTLDDIMQIEAGGYTNWEAAFQLANTLAPVPNITLFITDGNPTVSVGYCAQADFDNHDFFASRAGDDAAALRNAGSRVIPILFGDGVNVEFATTLVASDGMNTSASFCDPDPPAAFTPSAIISSNVSGMSPLVDGEDYFTAPNVTALADLILTEVMGEICYPSIESPSRSSSQSLSPSSSLSRSSSLSQSPSSSQSRSHTEQESTSQSASRSASASPSHSHSMSRSVSFLSSRIFWLAVIFLRLQVFIAKSPDEPYSPVNRKWLVHLCKTSACHEVDSAACNSSACCRGAGPVLARTTSMVARISYGPDGQRCRRVRLAHERVGAGAVLDRGAIPALILRGPHAELSPVRRLLQRLVDNPHDAARRALWPAVRVRAVHARF